MGLPAERDTCSLYWGVESGLIRRGLRPVEKERPLWPTFGGKGRSDRTSVVAPVGAMIRPLGDAWSINQHPRRAARACAHPLPVSGVLAVFRNVTGFEQEHSEGYVSVTLASNVHKSCVRLTLVIPSSARRSLLTIEINIAPVTLLSRVSATVCPPPQNNNKHTHIQTSTRGRTYITIGT